MKTPTLPHRSLAALLAALIAFGGQAPLAAQVLPGGAARPAGVAWGPVLAGTFQGFDPSRAAWASGFGVDASALVQALKGYDFSTPEGQAVARPMTEWLEAQGGAAAFKRLAAPERERLVAEAAIKTALWARSEAAALVAVLQDGSLTPERLVDAHARLRALSDAGIHYLTEAERPAVLSARDLATERVAALKSQTAQRSVTGAEQAWGSKDHAAAVQSARRLFEESPVQPGKPRRLPPMSTFSLPQETSSSGIAAKLRAGWLGYTEARALASRTDAILAIEAVASPASEREFTQGVETALDRIHADVSRAESWAAAGRAEKAREDAAAATYMLARLQAAIAAGVSAAKVSDPRTGRYSESYYRRDTDFVRNQDMGNGRWKHEVLVVEASHEAGPKAAVSRLQELDRTLSADSPAASGPSTTAILDGVDLDKVAQRAKDRAKAMKALLTAALTFGVAAALLSGIPLPELPARMFSWFSLNLLPELKMVGIGALGFASSFYIKAKVDELSAWALKKFTELKPRQQNFIVQTVGVVVMGVALSKTVNFMGVDWFTIAKVAAGGIGTVLATFLLTMITKAPGLVNNLPFQDFISGMSMVFSSPVEEGDRISFEIDGKKVEGTVRDILLQRTRVDIEENGEVRQAWIKNSVITDAKVITRTGSGEDKAAPQSPKPGPGSTSAVHEPRKTGKLGASLGLIAALTVAGLLFPSAAFAGITASGAGMAVTGTVIGAVVGFLAGTVAGWKLGNPGEPPSATVLGIYLFIRGGIALIGGLAGGLVLAVAGSIVGALI